MTVSSSTSTASYVGSEQEILPLTFRFFDDSEVLFYRVDPLTGASTLQVLGVDYTLTGAGEPEVNGNAVGTIVLAEPLATGTNGFAERILSEVQGTDFVNQGRFFAEVHEDSFDYVTMLIQQLANMVGNALKLVTGGFAWDFLGKRGVNVGAPVDASDVATKGYVDTLSSTNFAKTLRTPEAIPAIADAATRAERLLGFDASGNPVPIAAAAQSATDLEIRLANASDPAKGAALVGWVRTAPVVDASTVSGLLNALVINIWEYADLVTNKPTPSNPATWDWQPALQAALNTNKPVYLPTGTYSLFTPVTVGSGACLFGDSGHGAGFINGTILKPTTSAIVSSNFTSQFVFFTMRNIGVQGGTKQIDLGLMHEVDITDCSFYGATQGSLIIVRGEKHRLERIRIDAVNPGVFGLSIGRWEESTYGGYSDAFFAPDGAFFDRASIKDVHLQASPSGYFAYGLKTNIISNTTFINFIEHGAQNNGEISVIYVRTRMQLCELLDVAPDNLGGAGTKMPAMFDLASILSCTFLNVSPAFAGNNSYDNGFRLTSAFNTTFIGCHAGGDNVTVFGFNVGNAAGQTATMIGCRGSFSHASANALIRAQYVQIGCDFSGGNNGGSSNSNINDQNLLSLLMADANGTAASTAQWGATFANGGGTMRTPFYVKKETAWLAGVLSFRNAFAEAVPITVIVNTTNNVTPEGVVTANAGSLYLFYNSTTSGKLYVKESGSGNTGWVLK